ncbi:hypothetical protein C942_04668 [Photobacterium marinum]|uniref:Uncharacterized protein n=1 Tax=Photobacterium marinum TaxID=1056511 RepID=L8JHF3_9GAMM|nr:hypothetical protein C942_04668 [Photobacterium marinum]
MTKNRCTFTVISVAIAKAFDVKSVAIAKTFDVKSVETEN